MREDYILLCEECKKLLSWNDVDKDVPFGHICRMKKYKEEHYCESYIELYKKSEKRLEQIEF